MLSFYLLYIIMKKMYLLVVLLAGIILVWCNKQEPVIENIEAIVSEEQVQLEQPKWLEICAYFTEEFVNKYQYEDSKWYRFAFKIDWSYYNVFRNKNGWVSNSEKHWLTWAIPAYLFKEPFCIKVPFGKIKVAKINDYWFEYKNFKLKEIYNIEISPVKEWIETHTIWYSFY